MTNIEIYYRNVITKLEDMLSEAEEVYFDIDFQLNDEQLTCSSNQNWRQKARYKLRKTNSDISKLKGAIKKQTRKLNIAIHFRPIIISSITIRKSAGVAHVENEVMCQVLRAKLKEVMGIKSYMTYMEGNISVIQKEIRDAADLHFESTNRMPAAIEIYNWKK